MDVAREQPPTVGLFAVNRDSMAGQFHGCSAGSRSYRQGVLAARIGDLIEDGDFLNLTHAMNESAFVTGSEAVRKFLAAQRLPAWIQENHIVRHQGEQSRNIARIDGFNPGGMHRAYCAFLTSRPHVLKISGAPGSLTDQWRDRGRCHSKCAYASVEPAVERLEGLFEGKAPDPIRQAFSAGSQLRTKPPTPSSLTAPRSDSRERLSSECRERCPFRRFAWSPASRIARVRDTPKLFPRTVASSA